MVEEEAKWPRNQPSRSAQCASQPPLDAERAKDTPFFVTHGVNDQNVTLRAAEARVLLAARSPFA